MNPWSKEGIAYAKVGGERPAFRYDDSNMVQIGIEIVITGERASLRLVSVSYVSYSGRGGVMNLGIDAVSRP